MAIIGVLLFLFALLMLGGGALLWVALKQRQQPARVSPGLEDRQVVRTSGARLPFRWRYVIAPHLVLLASVVAAAYFFRLLPVQISYGYASGSTVANHESRTLVLLVLIAPQFILAIMSAAVAYVVARVGERFIREGGAPPAAIESIAMVMSNMVVLPQLVLSYAMVDLFRYNAYGTHLPPLYLFAAGVMVLGGAILGLFFLRAIQQARVVK